jgi:cell division septation protein DedD
MIKADLGDKGVWYRVFTGHFKNRDNAEAFISEKGLADAKVKKMRRDAATNVYLAAYSRHKKRDSEKEEPLPELKALSYPYSIYLGSYRTLVHAKKAISKYQERGLSPYWVKLDLGSKGVWFRVFAGYFRERDQANEFIEEEKIEEAESRHTKYTNLVGVFESQKELDEEKIRLSTFEVCPYAIPGPNGQFRLYVGAFYQKARARRQHAELASKGIHSQIVER